MSGSVSGSVSDFVPGTVSAEALRDALASAGFACDVEAHDRLAVLVPDDAGSAARMAEAAARLQASALAREHGFTHAALELRDWSWAVGTDGVAGERAPLHRD